MVRTRAPASTREGKAGVLMEPHDFTVRKISAELAALGLVEASA